MGEVVEFAKAKSDADRDRSHHIVSLDVFMNADNSETWASVTEVDMQEMDADWHRFIAERLRALAWLADGMAAEMSGEGAPVASVNVFDDTRILTRWNDDLVQTDAQVQWVKDQFAHGAEEITASPAQEGEE